MLARVIHIILGNHDIANVGKESWFGTHVPEGRGGGIAMDKDPCQMSALAGLLSAEC